MIDSTPPSDSASSGAERRRYPRVPLDLPLTVSLDDGIHEGRLRDVSSAGVCFFLDREVPEMTILRMRFDLPVNGSGGSGAVDGTGVVVRCRPLSPCVDHYEIAVFLNDLTEGDRRRITEFVRHNLVRPGPG